MKQKKKKNGTILCWNKIIVYLCHPITNDYSFNLFIKLFLLTNKKHYDENNYKIVDDIAATMCSRCC